jgi:hypothetical protein
MIALLFDWSRNGERRRGMLYRLFHTMDLKYDLRYKK